MPRGLEQSGVVLVIPDTNPLERLNKEVKRRTAVVGIFLRVLLDPGADRCSGRCAIVAEGSRVTRNLCVEPAWL